MNHHFEIKSKDPSKESAILYKCYINGVRFTCGVGLKIYPELWDNSTQRPTTSKPLIKNFKSEIPNIEARITNLKTRLDNICHGVEAFARKLFKPENGMEFGRFCYLASTLIVFSATNLYNLSRVTNSVDELIYCGATQFVILGYKSECK